MSFREWLIENKACQPGLDCAGNQTIQEFWATCNRPDYLLWVAHHKGVDTVKLAHIARLCAAKMSHSQEIINHADFYETTGKSQPMILSEIAVSEQQFGDLKPAADIVRANLAVPE